MNIRKNSATGSAPAKVILFGEHFVVYENPAILASINRRVNIRVQLNNTEQIIIKSNLGIIAAYAASKFKLIKGGKNAKKILDPLYKSVMAILSERNHNSGINIELTSEVPYGIGLGTSAASCVAIVAALDSLFRQPDKGWVCTKAVQSENLIHKNSSGADCYVSTYGGLIYYTKKDGFKRIECRKDLPLIIINTGLRHSTGALVSSVRRIRDNNIALFEDLATRANRICLNAVAAIKAGNEKEIGMLMTENHTLLQKIGVSNKKIDQIIDICIDNGAFGAKLTGAGGGGSIIALMPPKNQLNIIDEIKMNRYECIPINIDYDGLLIY